MATPPPRAPEPGRARHQALAELARYVAWQVPGWLLVALLLLATTALLDLRPWIGAAVLGLFVLKDLVLFPVMRAVFRRPPAGGIPAGARGEAVEALAPTGYVRVNGELWRARARGAPIPAGRRVRIVEARGLTLVVDDD